MTSGLQSTFGWVLGRYGKDAVVRPQAVEPTVAGNWRLSDPAVAVSGHVLFRPEDVVPVAPLWGIFGEWFRVDGRDTWHQALLPVDAGGGLVSAAVEPALWDVEGAAGRKVLWASSYQASGEYPVKVLTKQRSQIFQSGESFYGDELFLVPATPLLAAGYDGVRGMPAGTGISIAEGFYAVQFGKAVLSAGGLVHYEVLASRLDNPAVGTLTVDGGGRVSAGADATLRLFVHGDPVGAWRWSLEENTGVVWASEFPAVKVAVVASEGTTVVNRSSAGVVRFRVIGDVRAGGYTVSNEVRIEWV